MRIYLAARFGRWAEVSEHAEMLELLGHGVTSRWHSGDHATGNAAQDANPTPEQSAAWAAEDVGDLLAADCVISFTEEPRSTEGGRGGRHVEFGMALALGKRCVVVGPREHVFHRLPQVEWFEDFISLLEGWHPMRAEDGVIVIQGARPSGQAYA